MKEKREEGKVEKKAYEKPELTRCGKLTDVTSGITGENGGPIGPDCKGS